MRSPNCKVHHTQYILTVLPQNSLYSQLTNDCPIMTACNASSKILKFSIIFRSYGNLLSSRLLFSLARKKGDPVFLFVWLEEMSQHLLHHNRALGQVVPKTRFPKGEGVTHPTPQVMMRPASSLLYPNKSKFRRDSNKKKPSKLRKFQTHKNNLQ
jgi:hypothetical protein